MELLSREIARLLPGLRRYACAVSGGRRSADRYVRITLEILIEEPWRIRPGDDVKFSLYKLFDDVVSIFEPGPTGGLIDQADPYHQVGHDVSDLPTSSRKLLFLVERFPLSRAAELLRMQPRQAEIRLAGARARLSAGSPPP